MIRIPIWVCDEFGECGWQWVEASAVPWLIGANPELTKSVQDILNARDSGVWNKMDENLQLSSMRRGSGWPIATCQPASACRPFLAASPLRHACASV